MGGPWRARQGDEGEVIVRDDCQYRERIDEKFPDIERLDIVAGGCHRSCKTDEGDGALGHDEEPGVGIASLLDQEQYSKAGGHQK